MLKRFSGENFYKSRRNRATKWRFSGIGGLNVNVWFLDPQQANAYAKLRLLTYFASTCVGHHACKVRGSPPNELAE